MLSPIIRIVKKAMVACTNSPSWLSKFSEVGPNVTGNDFLLLFFFALHPPLVNHCVLPKTGTAGAAAPQTRVSGKLCCQAAVTRHADVTAEKCVKLPTRH